MKSFDEFLNENNIIQNLKDPSFDGSDPSSIQVHNQGVGGVRSLQGHREQIVRLLEEMLKQAKMAEKNHKLAHFNIGKILNLADPESLGGVFLRYLKNHQMAVEELEQARRRGGSGPGRTVPKGLV
jgi:hypothetical protein